MQTQTEQPLSKAEQLITSGLQHRDTSSWNIVEALVVGAVWYAASMLFVFLGLLSLYSMPRLHFTLRFYQLDSDFAVFCGVLAGILFAGPLVMWIVRRGKFGTLQKSIRWDCSNKVFALAFVIGLASGVGYCLAKSLILGRGYQTEGIEHIAGFVVLTGLVQPAMEEAHFRGILFTAVGARFGNIPSVVVVTLLFCLIHPKHFLTVLPLAVLLGAVRLYSGSVRACFGCHAAYNLSLIFFMLPITLHV